MNSRSAGSQAQPLRSMNMNAFGTQPNARQPSRLQNTQKPALGNGNAGGGWAFGGPSSGGFGGLGGAPGLGPGRPGQLSGFAQVMGGGGGQGPIDMSEFPSLAGPPGQPRQQQANVGWNSSVIRQPTTQQPQAAPPQQAQPQPQQPRAPSAAPSQQSIDQFDGQRSQQASTERSGGGDEFPPLSGQLNSESSGQTNGFNSGITSPLGASSQPIGQPIQQPTRDASSTFQQPQQAPIGPAPPASTQQNPADPSAQTGEGFIPWYEQEEHQRFGLEALNNKFEAARGNVDISMPNIEKNVAMMQGQNLDFHDMNLDSAEPIHPNFSVFPNSEWDDRPMVPAFDLPDSYTVKNVPPAIGRVESFTDDTLFKIFFEEPRTVLSETAATELTSREWRWHKVLRKWLQKEGVNTSCTAPIVDYASHMLPGAQSSQVSERIERGVFILYDERTVQRERREITLDFGDIDTRHMGPALLQAINMGASPLSGAPAHAGQVQGASR